MKTKTNPVWTYTQTFIATLFGGPPAGFFLISQNYKALNNPLYAKRAFWAGIISMALLTLTFFLLETFFPELYDKIPKDVVAITTAAVTLSFASPIKKPIKALMQTGSPKQSYFKLLLITLLSLLSILILGFCLEIFRMYFFG